MLSATGSCLDSTIESTPVAVKGEGYSRITVSYDKLLTVQWYQCYHPQVTFYTLCSSCSG